MIFAELGPRRCKVRASGRVTICFVDIDTATVAAATGIMRGVLAGNADKFIRVQKVITELTVWQATRPPDVAT
jgi:hypothetical protein